MRKSEKHENLRLYLVCTISFLIFIPSISFSQKDNNKLADKPLFHDPVYEGAADPSVIWNSKKKNILQEPGTGADDGVKGQHPCVVLKGERAYIFYFTHFAQAKNYEGINDFSRSRRSAIQVAGLEYVDGQIVCNRDNPVYINLRPLARKR